MGRPWRKNRDESSRIAEQVNTTQEVIEQQESPEQKALQEAVWYLEIEQQLIALQMESLKSSLQLNRWGLRKRKKNMETSGTTGECTE